MNKRRDRYFLSASVVLFAASLTQPAFVCQGKSWLGYEVLMLGWLAVLGLDPRWWANLALQFVWRWLFCGSAKPVPKLPIIFIGLAALSAPMLPSGIGCPGMDSPTAAKGLAIGGALWVASLSVAFVGALVSAHRIHVKTP